MNSINNQDPMVYFTVLVVLELIVIIMCFIAEPSLAFFSIIGLISLVAAKCMNAVTWVIQFIIFSLLGAILSFSPVGLWISGHGGIRSGTANALCLVIFLLLILGTYIGFLYYKAVSKEMVNDFVGQGYNNPNQGGGGYGYQGGGQPDQGDGYGGFGGFGGYGGGQQEEPNQRQGGFREFAGQGYSLS